MQLAGLLGWCHLHVRRSIGRGSRWTTTTNVIGWPDLLLWHERQRRVVAAELKTDTGRPSAEQLAVLASLEAAGIETHVWRPSQFDEIQGRLRAGARYRARTIVTGLESCAHLVQ